MPSSNIGEYDALAQADRDAARMALLDEQILLGWGDVPGYHIDADWRTKPGPELRRRQTVIYRDRACSDCGGLFRTAGSRSVRCPTCQREHYRQSEVQRKRRDRESGRSHHRKAWRIAA